ncbi:MAG: SAM-dependent chlorinase/fluorinase [Pyrinomonadaceae bacterium]
MKIALLTDFGMADYYVAAMKGVIFSINGNAAIVEITHEISPQDIRSASFVLGACFREFPKGTIFVSVVDPAVGSGRRAIVVNTESYLFTAPDNGILSFVFSMSENIEVFEATETAYFKSPVSTIFHGRDIFAPLAAHLSLGESPIHLETG